MILSPKCTALRPPEYIIRDFKEGNPAELSYRKPHLPGTETLESYQGPTALIIPGNHDWYDGLQTFSRFILNRNWIGGWFLPQSSSYFVKVLPHHWWIFGVDYALNNDIDPRQFQYFAKVVEAYFDDTVRKERVIIMTHAPDWVVNDHEHVRYGQNLSYLIDTIIGADRLRLRIAGDIHNYTRHESQSSILSGLRRNAVLREDDSRNLSPEKSESPPSDIALIASKKKVMNRSRSAADVRDYDDLRTSLQCDPSLVVSGGGGAC